MSTKPKKLSFRPYARLLTMLGDQLIKNERVALVEVIKNSYDADATWVKVGFEGFDESFRAGAGARIIIEDDGNGMTRTDIEDHWVNPATPQKWISKKTHASTKRGRIVQGEKGIGRFALLKLGKRITIITRPVGAKVEYTITLDLSAFNENFIGADKHAMFLDELSIGLSETSPSEVIKVGRVSIGSRKLARKPHGTRIEIDNLSDSWTRAKVEKVFDDLARLQSIFDLAESTKDPDPFEVVIHRGTVFEPFSQQRQETLRTLIEQNAVLRIEEGKYDEDNQEYSFNLNGEHIVLGLNDSDISGKSVFRKRFGKAGELLKDRGTACGSFEFAFYVFDMSVDAPKNYQLDKDEKDLIKEHRIYLYRDGIRVYPYGDKEDDWLQIDVHRGTIRASDFLSNDQVVGFVEISQEENPSLRDKTSREGLIDTGDATEDFRALLQTILAWIRKKPYDAYRRKIAKNKNIDVYKKNLVENALETAAQSAEMPKAAQKELMRAAALYRKEKSYLVQRAETTEHLAGVGLSVETASHDLMMAMGRCLRLVDSLIIQTNRPGDLDPESVNRDLSTIRGALSFVETQLKDLQLLFKSSKQRRRPIRIQELLDKVLALFGTALREAEIEPEINVVGSPLVAKTTEAVILQLLLNLFDNAIYWLAGQKGTKRIRVDLNGSDGTLVFADNGPGFKKEDIPYLFEPFFSGKGEDGRGLGLYIARQLLERHSYTIEVADAADRILSGANILVSFVSGDES